MKRRHVLATSAAALLAVTLAGPAFADAMADAKAVVEK